MSRLNVAWRRGVCLVICWVVAMTARGESAIGQELSAPDPVGERGAILRIDDDANYPAGEREPLRHRLGIAFDYFNPVEDDIYGDSLLTTLTFDLVADRGWFARFGAGLGRDGGDHSDRYFIGGPKTHQTLLPLEVSVGARRDLSPTIGIQGGAGVTHVSLWESRDGFPRAFGSSLGFTMFVGPEFMLSDGFYMSLSWRLLVAELTADSGVERYDVNATGSAFQIGLRVAL